MMGYNQMYEKLPNLVFGFHGCDKSTYEKVIFEHENLKYSDNKYDWLGNGIYFWENSYQRALDWAINNPKYKEPAVIGAVIDLGRCLNLTDYHSSEILKKGYDMLVVKNEILNISLPQNGKRNKNSDILLRNLDCAVIEQIHQYHKDSGLPAYDSVRGVFIEGKPAFEGSEFREKTHIQLCIKNPNCIKGYFDPRRIDEGYPMP
ncbi:hypothetical protein [Anaerostipes hadrus]|jgi:hypothetical protein|uniref:hypothetical protein n=1 Tax=Anaerostipes hadrus TaxID=649756 RepID=UPI001FC8B150|nr:hypothetical protein [Anaerostipes hadrus]